MISKDKSVWQSSNKKKYFLIPNDYVLPAGSEVLSTLAGNEKKVDIEVLKEFEVSQEEAKVFLENELNEALKITKRAFRNLEVFMTGSLKNEESTSQHILHQSLAFKHLVDTFMEMIPANELNLSGNSERPAKPLEPADLTHKVKEYLTSAAGEASLKSIARKLRQLASKLEHPEKLGKSFEEIISSLGQEFFDESDPQKERKAREKRIKKSVEDSITKSLDLSGFKVFSGSDPNSDKE